MLVVFHFETVIPSHFFSGYYPILEMCSWWITFPSTQFCYFLPLNYVSNAPISRDLILGKYPTHLFSALISTTRSSGSIQPFFSLSEVNPTANFGVPQYFTFSTYHSNIIPTDPLSVAIVAPDKIFSISGEKFGPNFPAFLQTENIRKNRSNGHFFTSCHMVQNF